MDIAYNETISILSDWRKTSISVIEGGANEKRSKRSCQGAGEQATCHPPTKICVRNKVIL
jgi:hypothetical protein